MKLLNFGSLNIDFVYNVDHIVLPGETLSGGDVRQFAGGKGANQSVALAKAGAPVYHAGKIGKEGFWLLEKLKSFGVNTDFVRTYDGPTGHAIIQVTPQGENSIILSGGGNRRISSEDVDLTLSSFEAGDYLVLQNEINGTEDIIEKASRKGMRICVNPAPFDASILSWPLHKVDILVVNEHEAAGMAGTEGSPADIMDRLTEKYPGAEVLMTLGSKGSLFGKGSERIEVGAETVKPVDTTAAGDTYMGFYLASLVSGFSTEESMGRASRAAALTVTRAGAMDSIPYESELN